MKRVLFVCIGNTCRSPMAEAFANHYGRDVLMAASAGLMPVSFVDPRTVEVMQERGIDVSAHVPSYFDAWAEHDFDLIVNLTGMPLYYGRRDRTESVIDWQIKDPFRAEIEVYREVRDEIERRVMLLILELRRARRQAV